MAASVCSICDTEFKPGTVTLTCSTCPAKFCLSCPFPIFKGKGQKEIAAALASSKHVTFACLACVGESAPSVSEELAKVDQRIAELKKSVEEKMEELNAHKSALNPLAEDFQPADIPGTSWAKVVRRKAGRPAPSAPPTYLQRTFQTCLAEEDHKKSIVVENLPAPSKVNGVFQEHEDVARVEEMLSDIGLGHLRPYSVYRMGSIDESKPALPKLKVSFDSSGVQSKILASKHLLHRLDKWNKVFIRPSMPKEYRQALYNLRVQCRRLLEKMHGPDWKRKLDEDQVTVKYGVRDGAISELKLVNRPGGDVFWRKVRIVPETEFVSEADLEAAEPIPEAIKPKRSLNAQ